jgi:hypothetical protein
MSSPPSYLLSPKSAIPTIEECKMLMAQIGSKIQKAKIMFDNTTHCELQPACQQWISNLVDKQWFHQIVHKRHRVQTILQTTRVVSVRVACKEQL